MDVIQGSKGMTEICWTHGTASDCSKLPMHFFFCISYLLGKFSNPKALPKSSYGTTYSIINIFGGHVTI